MMYLLPMSDRLTVACLTAPVGRGDTENLHLAGARLFLLLKEISSEEPTRKLAKL